MDKYKFTVKEVLECAPFGIKDQEYINSQIKFSPMSGDIVVIPRKKEFFQGRVIQPESRSDYVYIGETKEWALLDREFVGIDSLEEWEYIHAKDIKLALQDKNKKAEKGVRGSLGPAGVISVEKGNKEQLTYFILNRFNNFFSDDVIKQDGEEYVLVDLEYCFDDIRKAIYQYLGM